MQGPLQQVSDEPVHAVPVALHVTGGGGVQRRSPFASGTHGTPPQHWSLNWQMPPGVVVVPAAMQQPGVEAS